jgi:hypothetical protein
MPSTAVFQLHSEPQDFLHFPGMCLLAPVARKTFTRCVSVGHECVYVRACFCVRGSDVCLVCCELSTPSSVCDRSRVVGALGMQWCQHQSAGQWVSRPLSSVSVTPAGYAVPLTFQRPPLPSAPRLRRMLVARERVQYPTDGPRTLWHAAEALMLEARGVRVGLDARGLGSGGLMDVWDLESSFLAVDVEAVAGAMAGMVARCVLGVVCVGMVGLLLHADHVRMCCIGHFCAGTSWCWWRDRMPTAPATARSSCPIAPAWGSQLPTCCTRWLLVLCW